MTMTIEERVLNGAALLDRTTPGWESLVDLNRLDLCMTADCVLGQVYGYYGTGLRELSLCEGIMGDGGAWANGFTCSPCSIMNHSNSDPRACACRGEFSALTEAWREFITVRRAPVKTGVVARLKEMVSA